MIPSRVKDVGRAVISWELDPESFAPLSAEIAKRLAACQNSKQPGDVP